MYLSSFASSSIPFSGKKIPLKNRLFQVDALGNYQLNRQGLTVINQLFALTDTVTIPNSTGEEGWRIRKTEVGWTFQLYTLIKNDTDTDAYSPNREFYPTPKPPIRESFPSIPKVRDAEDDSLNRTLQLTRTIKLNLMGQPVYDSNEAELLQKSEISREENQAMRKQHAIPKDQEWLDGIAQKMVVEVIQELLSKNMRKKKN